MSVAPALAPRDGDRKKLSDLTRLPSMRSGLARRARIVMLAAEGMPNAQIARTVGVSRPTVIGWRDRYAAGRDPGAGGRAALGLPARDQRGGRGDRDARQ
jgi:Homeodomain-like domain